jgi:hypothetical protein
MINLKKGPGSGLNFKTATPKRMAKAMIPEKTIITAKTIALTKPAAKTNTKDEIVNVSLPKASAATQQIKVAAPTKTAITTNPAKASAQLKLVAPAKPVLSAKHIVKSKKVTSPKPTARFTIAFARPVATFTVTKPKPVALPRPVAQAIPVVKPKPDGSVQPIAPPKPAAQQKPVAPSYPIAPPKPVTPAVVYPPHEIIKSNVSLKDDILAHPQDYETQAFDFDLECPNSHFWSAGRELPVSKGKAYCLQCGERLSKPKPKKHRRFRRRAYFN